MQNLVFIMLLLVVVGCGGIPQRLNPEKFYKRDLPYCIDNVGCYEGVSVVPFKKEYRLEIEPKGGANIDLLLATSCHREESFEKTDSGWFIFKTKKRFTYYYHPSIGIEDDGACELFLNTFEKDKGRHAWAIMRTEHPDYQLRAMVSCNGKMIQYGGKSVCQSKVGLRQHIDFGGARIQFAPPMAVKQDGGKLVPDPDKASDHCPWPKKVEDKEGKPIVGRYFINLASEMCSYISRNEGDERHSLLTVGYEGILIREQ